MMAMPALIEAQTPAARRGRRMLWLIILVGIACRLLGVWALAGRFNWPDAADYDALAKAIAQGQEYQVNGLVATRMPGYPAFVSNFYVLFGVQLMPVLVAQALISGLTGFLVYSLGREISPRVGRIAAALYAVDPLTIGFAAALLSESLFTTLLLLMLWLALRVARFGRVEEWLALGLIGTVATYVRAEAYWLVVPLGAAMVAASVARSWAGRKRARWGSLGLGLTGYLAAWLMVVSLVHPWQSRNALIFPATGIDLTSLEGISLYEAVYPQATGGPMQDKIKTPQNMVALSEGQLDAQWKHMAWEEIKANPGRIARLALVKAGRTWSPWMNAADARNQTVQAVLTLWHVGLYGLAVGGVLWVMRRRSGACPAAGIGDASGEPVTTAAGKAPGESVSPSNPRHVVGVLLVPVLYFTAVHMLFLGSVRYRVPVMPVMHVLAACGVSCAWSRFGAQPGAPERV